jgi:hypothetical protein
MIDISIPWDKIELPNRSLLIDNKVIEKFPFLKDILESAYKKTNEESLFKKIFLDEVIVHGLDEDSELIFFFNKIFQNIYIDGPRFYRFPYYKYPSNITIKIEKLSNQTQNDLLEFINKLNKKRKELYTPLKKLLDKKMMETQLRKLLENPPEEIAGQYDINYMIDIFKAYTPTPSLIQWKYPKKHNPKNEISFGNSFLSNLDNAHKKLKETIERQSSNNNISKQRQQELLAKVEKVIADTEDEIFEYIQQMDKEKYIIELDKL